MGLLGLVVVPAWKALGPTSHLARSQLAPTR